VDQLKKAGHTPVPFELSKEDCEEYNNLFLEMIITYNVDCMIASFDNAKERYIPNYRLFIFIYTVPAFLRALVVGLLRLLG